MKKSGMLVLVGVIVVVLVLYTGGYLTGGKESSTGSSISVLSGWNDITIPDSWPDTTAKELMDENPSITTVSYWSTSGGVGHWVSCYSIIPNTNNFDITAGMELKVLASGNGLMTAPM